MPSSRGTKNASGMVTGFNPRAGKVYFVVLRGSNEQQKITCEAKYWKDILIYFVLEFLKLIF